jgi:glc operon protein GlcG
MNVITHQEVLKGIEAGLAVAQERGVLLGLAIVDEGGNLIGAVSMLGSGYPWICDDARGKAMATVFWKGTLSGEMQERAGSPMMTWLNNHYGGRLNFLRGAVPIMRNGELIGAAGAGGGPTEIDEAVAWAMSHSIGD